MTNAELGTALASIAQQLAVIAAKLGEPAPHIGPTVAEMEAEAKAKQVAAAEAARKEKAAALRAELAELERAGAPVPNGEETEVRIDDATLPGTPGTVTLPSGRVMSVPIPCDANGLNGENFVGYCQRVYRQCDGDINRLGVLFGGTEWIFRDLGGWMADGANWPAAAEKFWANNRAELASLPSVLSDRYASEAALRADTARVSGLGYKYAVILDGVSIHRGFGPPDRFKTNPDGTVSSFGPPAAVDTTETVEVQ
jgi:hypothetical protein